MNFIKRGLLERELRNLEFELTRYYALSTWITQLEGKKGNVIQKALNGFALNRANREYESLSPKVPNIESRIYKIKSELREY